MLASYLERNPSIIQRFAALCITKSKEELISDCLHGIFDSYKSAQLDQAPIDTRCLLHLTNLLPGDNLSEKVKAHLIEKMRLTPNIQSLEEIMTYFLSQEVDDFARRNPHNKSKVNRVGEGDGDPPKKDQKCMICDKKYPRGSCVYKCSHCGKKAIRAMVTG